MELLKVRDLHTSFFTDAGEVRAVNGISFNLEHGKVLGIVGESGSGKSVTAYSIMQILASTGKIVSGSIKYDGQELVGSGEKFMQTIRGNKISIIFQDPMTSLNPTYTIGHQLMEAILLHTDRNKQQARERAIEMLCQVNVDSPEKRLNQYPYEFSGGMQQRVMIAMALTCEPDILIADEPTTALDVTTQMEVLKLIDGIRRRTGTGWLFITHNLGLVSEFADRVAVMYVGQIVETGPTADVLHTPMHPYTRGLMAAVPRLEYTAPEDLTGIPGRVPQPSEWPSGCGFAARCPDAALECSSSPVQMRKTAQGRECRCIFAKG